MRLLSLAMLSTLLLVACGGGSEAAGCREGQLLACACVDGTSGTKACGSDACVCETPACALSHVDELEFGRVPPGHASARELLLVNDGEAPCALSALRLDACGTDASLDVATGPLTIPAGGAVPVPVRFHPEGDGELSCALRLDLADPAASDPTVRLHGTGDAACLAVDWGPIAMEAEAPGCATDEAVVTAANACDVELHLDAAWLEGDAFVLLAAPPLPSRIAPGARLSLAVGFRPAAPGEHEGFLRLGFRDFTPWTVLLVGTAGELPWVTEHFQTRSRPKVDVLFVIDNGTAMAEHQATLLANLPAFLSYARAQEVDLHLGVTTTGLEPGGDCPGGVGGGEDGRLFPVLGETPRVLTREEGTDEDWIANLQVGACREGPNRVFEAAVRALTPPVSDSVDDPRHPEEGDGNAGFLRQEAHLSVIAVTDREDESPGEPNFFYNALQSLKGFRNTHLFNFHAIAGDRDEGCTSGGNGSAAPADRLTTLVDKTDGGTFQSICDATWDNILREATGAAYSWPSYCFYLAESPADLDGDGEVTDTAGEIEVRVDGEVIPSRGMQGERVWSYRKEQVALCFEPLASPGYDHVIDVRYRQECR